MYHNLHNPHLKSKQKIKKHTSSSHNTRRNESVAKCTSFNQLATSSSSLSAIVSKSSKSFFSFSWEFVLISLFTQKKTNTTSKPIRFKEKKINAFLSHSGYKSTMSIFCQTFFQDSKKQV